MIVQLFDPTWYITNPTGFDLFGDLLFGANGMAPWTYELAAGSTPTDSAGGGILWDGDLEDGFDSGEVDITFDADLSDGSVEMTAGGASVAYDGQSGGTIGSVVIRAGADVAGFAEFTRLTIKFWDDGVVFETATIGGVSADTAESTTGVAEQQLVVTPASSSCERVTMAGVFRMSAAPEAMPDVSSLFGQILITKA